MADYKLIIKANKKEILGDKAWELLQPDGCEVELSYPLKKAFQESSIGVEPLLTITIILKDALMGWVLGKAFDKLVEYIKEISFELLKKSRANIQIKNGDQQVNAILKNFNADSIDKLKTELKKQIPKNKSKNINIVI